jgi:Tol biopolymer transport system component
MKPDTDLHDRLERAGGSVSIDVQRRLDAVHAVAERRGRNRRVQALAVAAVIGLLAVLAIWQLRSSDGRAPAPATTAGPDGRIAFLSAYDDSRGLFVLEAAEGDSRPLYDGQGTVLWGAWSPDGSRLALTLELTGPRYELVVTDADGSDPVTIVAEEGTGAVGPDFLSLAWSPDGSTIAYAGRTLRGGVANRTIFVVDADGSGRPTVLEGHWEAVSWSPDGRRLVLVGFPDPEDPTFDLYTSAPDGSHLAQLTHDASIERTPSWSPDGRQIVYSTEADPGVFVMAADGSDVRRLTDRRGWDLLPAWSPDGAWIAFTSDRGATPEQQAANRSGDDVTGFALYVMRPDGSDVRLLLEEDDALLYATSWTW